MDETTVIGIFRRYFQAVSESEIKAIRESDYFKRLSVVTSSNLSFSDQFARPTKRAAAIWTSFRYEETAILLDDLLTHAVEVKYFITNENIYIGRTTIYDILYSDIKKITHKELSKNDGLDFIITFTEEDFSAARALCADLTDADTLYFPDLVDLVVIEKLAYPAFAKELPKKNDPALFVAQWPCGELPVIDFLGANSNFTAHEQNPAHPSPAIHLFYFLDQDARVRDTFSSMLKSSAEKIVHKPLRLFSYVHPCLGINEAAAFAAAKIGSGEIHEQDPILFIFPEEGCKIMTQEKLMNDFAARVREDLGLFALNMDKNITTLGGQSPSFDYRHAALEISWDIFDKTNIPSGQTTSDSRIIDFFIESRLTTLFIHHSSRISANDRTLIRKIASAGIEIESLTDAAIDVPCGDLSSQTNSHLILSFDEDLSIETVKDLQRKLNAEVVTHRDLIALTEDRFFLLEPMAEKISRTGIDVCILGWASADPAGVSSSPRQTEINAAFPNPDDAAKFYRDIPSYGREYYSEIFSPNTQMTPKNSLLKMSDCAGNFFNVRNGMRITTGQPEAHQRSVHIFGDEIVLGLGAEDSHTIASFLQKAVNAQQTVKLRVLNHGLMGCDVTAQKIMDNFKHLKREAIIEEGDIAIFLVNPLFHEVKGKRQKNATRYIETYMEKKGVHYLDLAPALRIAQKNNPIYIGGRHVNHRGYQAVANKIFFDFLRAKI